MGQLEERILLSLVALKDKEPECGRHMFVFPVSAVATEDVVRDSPCRLVKEGIVELMCRPEHG